MEYWRERYVEVEFAVARFITFRECLGEVQSQEREQSFEISIVRHYSIQFVSLNDIQTNDLNLISFQQVTNESILNISDISKTN